MKNNVKAAFLVTVALALAAPLVQAGNCRPANGHFQSTVVAPGTGHCPNVQGVFCTSGILTGSVKGTYVFTVTNAIPANAAGGPASVLFFVGNGTITLKDGWQLQDIDTGTFDTATGAFSSVLTFVQGGTGQLQLTGTTNLAAGTTSGTYQGRVCLS